MQNLRIYLIAAIAFLALSPVADAAWKDLSDKEKGEHVFSLHVAEIFAEKCNSCHGDDPDKIKGDFDMTHLKGLLKGGESFDDVLVPGAPEKSFLLDAIEWKDADYEMPPKENDRLTEEQIKKVRNWIKYGAPWPDEATRERLVKYERSQEITDEGILVKTSGGLGDDWTYRRYQPESLWAFQPLKKPPLPKNREPETVNREHGNPIDSFIQKKLHDSGFIPAPSADARTLIRRATYDLTGLPPTPKEVSDFLNAHKRDPKKAWNQLITRLLDSPHYGERWATHWLDIARYADTAGLSNDYERSNAWRYRDYVIRSFNDDKPYDQFIVEQIAGDELADEHLLKRLDGDKKKFNEARTKGDYTPEESELLIASSFLRMGPWDGAMVKAPEARQLYLDDTLNAIGQTFLSTTMRCFKCHDHKFDPLPTRDYYRMYSALATTQMAERQAPFLATENQIGFEGSKQMNEHLLGFAREKLKPLNAKMKAAANKWRIDNGFPKLKGKVDEETLTKIPDEEKPPRHAGLNETEKARLKVRKQDEWIWERRLERYEPMVQSVYNGSGSPTNGRSLRIKTNTKPDWRPESNILSGGSVEAPGEEVTPGVLSALGIPTDDASAEDPFRLTEDIDGRRLGLAQWIAHPRNPLTARSIVNRVWQYHFGKAIAGNPNNFGVSGKIPTHPELIDWLAVDFVENGWQLKRLHRLIMSSATYQQSSQHPNLKELANADPDNDLFAYYPSRRLAAEEIRDSMLRISGELNPVAGGLPIKPEMNMEVALQPRMIQFSLAPAYQPSRTPQQRNRRSIYAYRVRGLANPFLETFNQPNPNDSCEERDSASVSPQAFTLLNSDAVTDRSIAFALRVESERDNLESQVNRAVQLAFNRVPTAKEKENLLAYVKEMQDYHGNVDAPRKEYPTRITRYNVEEFSGQPFDYEEILPVFNNYVPDKKAADVTPNTRALADLCLALFNSNEFIYIY